MRTIASLLVGSLLALAPDARAHEVYWYGKPEPLEMVDGFVLGSIVVVPDLGEPCVVMVSLNPSTSPYVGAKVLDPNPSLYVSIAVEVLASPPGGEVMATITGEWHATGEPPNKGCTASGGINVPVIVRGAPFAQHPNAIPIGDPVSTATGEVTASAVDLSLGGPFPLAFARSYGSMFNGSGITSALGANWMHNFDASLRILSDTATVTVYPGKAASFRKLGGVWQRLGPAASNDQLVESGGNYEFVSPADGLIYTFSSAGKLAGIRDRNGNTLTVTQGASGPVLVADGLGRTLTFTYAAGRLSAVTDQTGRSVTFTRSGANLTKATDANGKATQYSYTSGATPSLLLSTMRPVGNTPWTQQFDTGGRVKTQTDSFAKSTTIAFDQPVPGARTITDPLGATAVHLYEGPGNLSQLTDPLGESTLFDYDADFRLTRVTDRLGNETDFAYDPASSYVASVLDAEGNTTSYSYTPQAQGAYGFFNLTGIQYADGTTIALTYDATGNVVGLTDQAGKPYSSTYNARGQLLTATNPAGGVVVVRVQRRWHRRIGDGSRRRRHDLHLRRPETRFRSDVRRRLVACLHLRCHRSPAHHHRRAR